MRDNPFGLTWLAGLVLLAGLPAGAPGQAPTAAAKAPAPASAPAKVLQFKGLRVDLAKRVIVMKTEVCQPTDALEFLVVRAGGKEYESLLRTTVKGQQLHAALLALGLTPGKPARWTGRGPWARFVPPQGPTLKLTARWKDKAGKAHEADVGQWVKIVSDRAGAERPRKWVFIGSEVTPDGRYWADIEGEIISVSNFASAVIDVPFESSNKKGMQSYEVDRKALPEAGTAVDLVIQPLPGAEKSPYARALLEIDRFGRLRLDGRKILPTHLERWGQAFTLKHPRAMVTVRADARALVYDVARAEEELRIAGVDEIQVVRLMAKGAVLPRTRGQMDLDLAEWADKFKNARDQLRDPGEEAEEVLKQLAVEAQYIKGMQASWAEYAKRLRRQLEDYKKSKPKPGRSE